MDNMNHADIALSLYNYASLKFGTEDVVKTRRLFYTILDYIVSKPARTYISSGSKGEGLDMKGSDFDVMFLYNPIIVFESTPEEEEQNALIMNINQTKPGFVMLKLYNNKPSHPLLRNCNTLFSDELYLSSHLVKIYFASLLNHETIVHGPCISDEDESFDIAVCLRCKSWIQQA